RCYRDWSSDVCSSDLHRMLQRLELDHPVVEPARPELDPELVLRGLPRGVGRDLFERARREGLVRPVRQQKVEDALLGKLLGPLQIGRAACRETGEMRE